MIKSESIGKISAALLKAQAAMGDATKGAKNPFFKSSYADLNAIREAVIPVANANGLSVLQPTVHEGGKSFVRTLVVHESGEFIGSDTEIVCAKANDPQAHGSGISYARRYGLQAFFNVGAVDDDGEAAMGRTAPKYPTATKAAPTLVSVDPPAEETTTAESPKKGSSFRGGKSKPSTTAAVAAPAASEEEGWT